MRLSRMSACWRLASPLMTLMKSNTTRRSQPITKSRLRRPTSKSITTVLCPRIASPVAIAAAVVVLPTPPLPDVTTMTLANAPSSSPCLVRKSARTGAAAPARQNREMVVDERHLRRLLQQLGRDRLADEITAGDRDQLGFEALREDARALVARGAGDGAAAKCAIDMDVAVGDHLGAGADRRHDDEIGSLGIDLRSRADGLRHQLR